MLLFSVNTFIKNKDICKNNMLYVSSRDGVYFFFENDFFIVCKKVIDAINYDENKDIKDIIGMSKEYLIKNKIPINIYNEIMDFYSKNFDKEYCLFISCSNDEFFVHIPEQEPSSYYVKYSFEGRNDIIGIVHNHPKHINLKKFSYIDDNDTKFFVGYDILISYADNFSPYISDCRINVIGNFVNVNYEDIFGR